MTSFFLPLVQEAINFLEDKQLVSSIAKSTEKQTYAGALFALISKTACSNLDQEVRETTLAICLDYLTKQGEYPLTLNT